MGAHAIEKDQAGFPAMWRTPLTTFAHRILTVLHRILSNPTRAPAPPERTVYVEIM